MAHSHWPFGRVYLLIFIRYLRLKGRDVLFVFGNEHGVISMKEKKAKRRLHEEVIDKYDGIIRKSFIDFDLV
jgi:methionyl-tRNA synthetase